MLAETVITKNTIEEEREQEKKRLKTFIPAPNNIEIYEITKMINLPGINRKHTNVVFYILNDIGEPIYAQGVSLEKNGSIPKTLHLADMFMTTPISYLEKHMPGYVDSVLINGQNFHLKTGYGGAKESGVLIGDKNGYKFDKVTSDDVKDVLFKTSWIFKKDGQLIQINAASAFTASQMYARKYGRTCMKTDTGYQYYDSYDEYDSYDKIVENAEDFSPLEVIDYRTMLEEFGFEF